MRISVRFVILAVSLFTNELCAVLRAYILFSFQPIRSFSFKSRGETHPVGVPVLAARGGAQRQGGERQLLPVQGQRGRGRRGPRRVHALRLRLHGRHVG